MLHLPANFFAALPHTVLGERRPVCNACRAESRARLAKAYRVARGEYIPTVKVQKFAVDLDIK